MAKGQYRSLRFTDVADEREEFAEANRLAGQILSAGDVRQLTVYAELFRLQQRLGKPATLMLIYPFVGPTEECLPDSVEAWNGSSFWLMPVEVKKLSRVRDAIRFPITAGKLSVDSFAKHGHESADSVGTKIPF